MPKVRCEELFPWELAEALATAPIAYLPLGTLEWHGEHDAIGLDTLRAHAECVRAAEISGGVVLPPVYWATDEREDLPDGSYLTGGVEHGERYHVPGNMFWLRPETYYNLLLDLYETLRRRGFRVILVNAGHWSGGTLPAIRASGAAFKLCHPEIAWEMVIDRELVPELFYPHEHAAGGETSLLMLIRPELVDLSRTFETARSLQHHYRAMPAHLARRAATPNKYIGVLRGVDDESNDPELTASRERGQQLFEAITARLAERACVLLAQTGFSAAG